MPWNGICQILAITYLWTQNHHTQMLIFFILYYKTSRVFRGFGQLSSSICCPFMAGPNLPWGQIIPIVNRFWFSHKLGFWAMLWVTDTLASQSMARKTWILDLISKCIEPKKWLNWLAYRSQVNTTENAKTSPNHDLTAENPKSKTKNVVRSQLEDLLNPQRVWTAP